jgi:hypothetical protein
MTLASVPGCAGALLVLTAVALTAVDAGAQPVPDRNFHTGMATGIGYAGVVPDAAARGGGGVGGSVRGGELLGVRAELAGGVALLSGRAAAIPEVDVPFKCQTRSRIRWRLCKIGSSIPR